VARFGLRSRVAVPTTVGARRHNDCFTGIGSMELLEWFGDPATQDLVPSDCCCKSRVYVFRSLSRVVDATFYDAVLHFPSFSLLSRTRNAVILRIRGKGSGFSSGNWIDPLAVANFESSFAKAFTAEGVG